MTTQAQLVRAWAKDQGYELGQRGRIAPSIWEAYANSHDGKEREAPVGSASCKCGRRWVGLRECHCTVCHRQFSTIDNFDAHRVDERCIDPAQARVKGDALRDKKTVWGVIYVREGEHWKTGKQEGLFDDEES